MYLKNVLKNKLSIRGRMTLFYTLAAFTLLTLITLCLYWETMNILYKADYEFLSDEADTTQYILNNNNANFAALKQEVVQIPIESANSIYRYYLRVYDANHKLLIQTPGMQKIVPLTNISALSQVNRKSYFWFHHRDKTYLLLQAPIKLAFDRVGVIEITLDISHQHTVISDRKIVFAVLFISGLCSLLLGFVVAQRGLRSLYDLTDTVKNITVKSLDMRIDPQSWPKELQNLGISFNQMLDRIESSFTRLKQFSSDLAHEIRTPINNLRGQTEIALTHNQNVNYYRSILESNLEELQRVSQLIENLLFLAKADNPRLELKKEKINVETEMKIICEFYQPVADEKQIRLNLAGNAFLHANPIMFKRMINNLLSNAIKYTPSGGQVDLHILSQTDKVNIIVRDTGIGIAPEFITKIFDRFYRVDSDRSQASGGTGLGLAIVKSIVDLHHGVINVQSIVNAGTTVEICLPS